MENTESVYHFDDLWILSRTPTLDAGIYAGILERARAQGYETERLERTLQASGDRAEPRVPVAADTTPGVAGPLPRDMR